MGGTWPVVAHPNSSQPPWVSHSTRWAVKCQWIWWLALSSICLVLKDRRKSEPILPKVYARLVNTNSKTQGSWSVKNQWPHSVWSLFRMHSTVCPATGQQLHTVTQQPKTRAWGVLRQLAANSSQVHKVSPWATCLKGWVSSKNCFHSLSISFSTNKRQTTHTQWMCLSPSDVSLSSQWVRRSSKLPEWLTCVINRRQSNIQ